MKQFHKAQSINHRSGHSKNKIAEAHGYSKDTWLLYKQKNQAFPNSMSPDYHRRIGEREPTQVATTSGQR